MCHYVFLVDESLPVAATSVAVTPGITTAKISFTIPNIAYTPENYSVSYSGLKFQTTHAVSVIRLSSSNISDINRSFVILLTGLEEDNTYQFTVDSENCLGITSTQTMNFTTLPTCKSVF